MILVDNELKLDNSDFELLKTKLTLISPINNDTDFTELNVPLLIPFLEMVEEKNINIKDVKNISFGIDNAVMGGAILIHFQEYSKFKSNEEDLEPSANNRNTAGYIDNIEKIVRYYRNEPKRIKIALKSGNGTVLKECEYGSSISLNEALIDFVINKGGTYKPGEVIEFYDLYYPELNNHSKTNNNSFFSRLSKIISKLIARERLN